MGGLSPWHILLIVVALAVLFGGRGKLSSIMGDAAKGVRAFKDGLKGDEETAPGAAASPAAPTPSLTSHEGELRDAQAREAALREELARQTAAREAAERRAREQA
ncbi:MAG: twin-arginine translocase TatA/TatE family subunit [Caulobacteraceae bacterium]|nr:twin-arginine translocase TatA/TatE family subunit [Caulobacter sp.]